MPSCEMLRRVALVRTDVSKELSVLRLLVTANVVPTSPILVTLMMEMSGTMRVDFDATDQLLIIFSASVRY
jgi:hypothetical protein